MGGLKPKGLEGDARPSMNQSDSLPMSKVYVFRPEPQISFSVGSWQSQFMPVKNKKSVHSPATFPTA